MWNPVRFHPCRYGKLHERGPKADFHSTDGEPARATAGTVATARANHLFRADGPLMVGVVGVHDLVSAFVDELVDGKVLAVE